MANLSDFISGGDPQYWVSGTTYALGKTVRSPADHQRYVRVVAGAGTTDPANDATNWRPDGGRPIKSIQRGFNSLSNGGAAQLDIAISAVNTAKTELRMLGGGGYSHDNLSVTNLPRISLVNSTTIRLQPSVANMTWTVNVSWELTEYY